jgi:hypothetical protein
MVKAELELQQVKIQLLETQQMYFRQNLELSSLKIEKLEAMLGQERTKLVELMKEDVPPDSETQALPSDLLTRMRQRASTSLRPVPLPDSGDASAPAAVSE